VTRNSSGSWFLSPDDGNVGYLDASGSYVGFDTGSRTAPADVVRGPDGKIETEEKK